MAESALTSRAQVRALDDGVGAVVAALKVAGMWDRALLVFASDNGGPTDGAIASRCQPCPRVNHHHRRRGTGSDSNMNNNFPLRGCKGNFFEGGIRVPAFLTVR